MVPMPAVVLAALLSLVLPVIATAAVQVPTTVVIIGCRVDDLTGQPGRQDPNLAARGWRDLEWHFDNGLELQCKREVVPLEDSAALHDPSVTPLTPNFSAFAQCASVAMSYAPRWEQANRGWAVMAVGCPVPITVDGKVVAYKMPDCPSSINGMDIKCKFDASLI